MFDSKNLWMGPYVHIEANLFQEHLLENRWCDEANIRLNLTSIIEKKVID